MDKHSDFSPDLASSTLTEIRLNRFPEDQGAGHVCMHAEMVGKDSQVFFDRDLTIHEESILLGVFSLIKVVGAGLEANENPEGITEAFAAISDATFLTFAAYSQGRLTGPEALAGLTAQFSALEALGQLYESDPLEAIRTEAQERTDRLTQILLDEEQAKGNEA